MSIKKSIYEQLFIESNDQSKTVDIKLGTASIDYYEDIFSPTITAKIVVANTGDSIKDSNDKLNIGTIDETSNKYGFIGNLRKPFTVLTWLASKSVPNASKNATAGFLFFQTKDGFQFRSIDKMITNEPKATYTYTEVNKSSIERDNDFTILKYSTNRNQNLLEKLRLGTYSSYRIFYNPLTFEFTPPDKGLFKLEDYVKDTKNLGQTLKLPKISNSSNLGLGDIPTRIFTQILDVGTLDSGVSTDKNAEPEKYQSQSTMRYNILFTQTLNMIVPSNTNLRAGDIIECIFPKISRENGAEFDNEQSGLYMIKELCHHFDTDGSYTSMMLVRDTFGKYGKNNKE